MIEDIKKRALHRARILEGQLRGVEKMIENEDYCVDIITQTLAIQKSLRSLNKLLVENHLRTHVTEMFDEGGETPGCRGRRTADRVRAAEQPGSVMEHDEHASTSITTTSTHGGRERAARERYSTTSERGHATHDHGHTDHSAHDPARFRRLFWICLALTVPTLVFSTGLQDILGLTGPRFTGSRASRRSSAPPSS